MSTVRDLVFFFLSCLISFTCHSSLASLSFTHPHLSFPTSIHVLLLPSRFISFLPPFCPSFLHCVPLCLLYFYAISFPLLFFNSCLPLTILPFSSPLFFLPPSLYTRIIMFSRLCGDYMFRYSDQLSALLKKKSRHSELFLAGLILFLWAL